MNLEKEAHKYLVDKGCLSIGQKYTAIEVQKMLTDFAEEQVKLYSQTLVNVPVCDCGNFEVEAYSPCCSLSCWEDKFS